MSTIYAPAAGQQLSPFGGRAADLALHFVDRRAVDQRSHVDGRITEAARSTARRASP